MGKKIKLTQQTKHTDLPATVGLVNEVRDELKADISSVHHDISAMSHDMRAMEARLDSKLAGLDSKIAGLDSKIADLDASVHRMGILMEEQRSENRIVLDAWKAQQSIIEKINHRLDGFDELFRALAKGRLRQKEV